MRRYVIKRIKDGKYYNGDWDAKGHRKFSEGINNAFVYYGIPPYIVSNNHIAVEVEIKEKEGSK